MARKKLLLKLDPNTISPMRADPRGVQMTINGTAVYSFDATTNERIRRKPSSRKPTHPLVRLNAPWKF